MAGHFGTVWGGIDKAVPGSKCERCLGVTTQKLKLHLVKEPSQNVFSPYSKDCYHHALQFADLGYMIKTLSYIMVLNT